MGLINFKSFLDLSPTKNFKIFPIINTKFVVLGNIHKYTTCLTNDG